MRQPDVRRRRMPTIHPAAPPEPSRARRRQSISRWKPLHPGQRSFSVTPVAVAECHAAGSAARTVVAEEAEDGEVAVGSTDRVSTIGGLQHVRGPAVLVPVVCQRRAGLVCLRGQETRQNRRACRVRPPACKEARAETILWASLHQTRRSTAHASTRFSADGRGSGPALLGRLHPGLPTRERADADPEQPTVRVQASRGEGQRQGSLQAVRRGAERHQGDRRLPQVPLEARQHPLPRAAARPAGRGLRPDDALQPRARRLQRARWATGNRQHPAHPLAAGGRPDPVGPPERALHRQRRNSDGRVVGGERRSFRRGRL